MPALRILVVAIVGLCCGTSVASAQADRSPQASSSASMDELVAEVRALRAEILQTASVSIRTQLLIGRLQLQEQRVTAVARDLASLRERLVEDERERAMVTMRLKEMESAQPNTLSPEQRADLENHVKTMKIEFEMGEKADQQKRLQEVELANLLMLEQGRWQDFNSRLDEIERQLSNRGRP